MDIFAKCYEPSLAGELKEKGVYPYFHALQSRQDGEGMMDGKRRIMRGSNGIDAGVVFPVADHVVVAAYQRGDDAHVGLEAGAEGDDAGLAQESAQTFSN